MAPQKTSHVRGELTALIFGASGIIGWGSKLLRSLKTHVGGILSYYGQDFAMQYPH